MNVLRKIRGGAAILLLCTIFLPLSQCSRHGESVKPPTAKALAHSRHIFPRSDDDFEYQYGIKDLDLTLRGALTVIAFLWPLAFLGCDRRIRRNRFWWIFAIGELLLCAGTAYWIGVLTLGGRWLYGAYAAEAVIGIYFVVSLMLTIDRARERNVATVSDRRI